MAAGNSCGRHNRSHIKEDDAARVGMTLLDWQQ
jgi:hypothetical protein